MTDAFHTLSDLIGFGINIAGIYVAQKPSTYYYTYGYHRAEVLGALASIIIIWGLLIWLNGQAIARLVEPHEDINALVMLITSCIGLLCNIINICQLGWEGDTEEDEEEEKP